MIEVQQTPDLRSEVVAKAPLASSSDYRDFLKCKFIAMKSTHPHFSIAVMARKVGCSSSFIKKLFAKKVHLGFRYAEAVTTTLELTPAEEEQVFLQTIYHSLSGERIRKVMQQVLK